MGVVVDLLDPSATLQFDIGHEACGTFMSNPATGDGDAQGGEIGLDKEQALKLVQLNAGMKPARQLARERVSKRRFNVFAPLVLRKGGRRRAARPTGGHSVVINKHGDVAVGTLACQAKQFGAVRGPGPNAALLTVRLAHQRPRQRHAEQGQVGREDVTAELALGLPLANHDEVKHG